MRTVILKVPTKKKSTRKALTESEAISFNDRLVILADQFTTEDADFYTYERGDLVDTVRLDKLLNAAEDAIGDLVDFLRKPVDSIYR